MKLRGISVLAAAAAVLVGCSSSPESTAEAPPADAPTTSPAEAPATDPTTSETPEPSAYPTSGDFGADLAALGISVDDVDDYRAYMAGNLCESDTDPSTRGPDSFKVMVERYGDGSAAEASGPDVVRLVIAYDCSERSEMAEMYLSEL